MRESILHKLRQCKNPLCRELTPYQDGYCETCIPPEQDGYEVNMPHSEEPDDGQDN